MALDVHGFILTDDHTSKSAAEVMSQMQLDQGSPKGSEACQELLRDLDFQTEHQDEEAHSQFVFQAQCLILGDSRVGKTSLVKSLTGKPFDSEEPSTKGVQTSLVDRTWQHLNADTGLIFGSFNRFYKSVRLVCASFESGGYNNLYDQDITSVLSPASKLLFMCWIISFICMWIFDTPSVYFSILSSVVLVTAMVFPFVLRSLRFISFYQELLASLSAFGSYPLITGQIGLVLVTVYVLTGYGIDCCVFQPVFSFIRIDIHVVIQVISLHFHLAIFSILVNGIIFDLLMLSMEKYCSIPKSDDVSSLPGRRVKFNDHVCIMMVFVAVVTHIPLVTFLLMIRTLSTLLWNTSALGYCQFLHFTIILCSGVLIYWLIRTLCRGSNVMEGIVSPILCVYIIENTSDSLTSFHSIISYAAMLAGCVCCSMYIMFHNSNYEVNQASVIYKYIFVEKVALDYQKLERALSSNLLSLKLSILDFAGDEEYYFYHHLFLRNQAMYVVVFNMAHFAADNFTNIAAKIQRLYFWLESICSQVAPKTPIFLIGTHRGDMNKSCLECLNEHLQQNLWNSFSDELIMNEEDRLTYFPIENKQGKNDRGIQNLRRKITCTAEECKTTMGRKIPFSWIKIQDAIISRRQNKKAKFCVTLDQFPTSFKKYFICSNWWSKETLKYFHEKGLVVYVDQGQHSELSKWVLLKPSVLVDIIIQLVTPPTDEELITQHGFRRDWTLLHQTGMLTESLMRNILVRVKENEEAMKGFLEEYDIICPLFYNVNHEKEEAQVTHFVPSLLPLSVNGNTPVWYNDPTDKRLFVFFKRFLPEPLFHHLLSRAHRLSMAGFPKGHPVIYRDVGRFWLTPTQPYRLKDLQEENMIEVTFSCRDGQGMKPSDVLSLVFSMVQGICQKHFPYVTFHCGPACSSDKCPGYQGDYISHPGVQRSSSRRHVFNVLPARQEELISSFYCVNQNFENDLREWLL